MTEKTAGHARGSLPLAEIMNDPARLGGLTLEALADLRRQAARLLADLDHAVTLKAAEAPMVAEPERLLDASEVAERLNLEVPYVYDLIRRGILPAVQIGKYKRVTLAGLLAFMAGEMSSPARRIGRTPRIGRREHIG